MSPTMATRSPSNRASPSSPPRSAWVGCWCQPSPALITTQWSTHSATRAGTPEELWRMITESIPIASMVSTVSRRDSPFFREEEPAANERTSADMRLAAVSNDMRVLVESSKNRVATVRPRSAGTLGLARRPTSAKESVTRSTSPMASASRSSMLRRWEGKCLTCSPAHQLAQRHPVVGHVDHLVPVRRQVLAHVVRSDGQLAVAPVHHDGQLHHLGASVLAEGVERGPDRPSGEEHVVDQDDRGTGQVGGDVGGRLGQHGA